MPDIDIPHLSNVGPFQNRISAVAPQARFACERSGAVSRDRLYGNLWNFQLDEGDAVYGRTEDFPADPLEVISDGRFVRVPYRRIPRIPIRSVAELQGFAAAIKGGDESRASVWRGQTHLHTLRERRSDEELHKLYGAIDVVEPSLLPSAMRSGTDIEAYLAGWLALLEVFLNDRHATLLDQWGAAVTEPLKEESDYLQAGYPFRSWAFGVAQHYGLPSTGLDLTPELDVALFFALHAFDRKPSGFTTIERVSPDAKPVILLMSVFEGDLDVDSKIAPRHLATPRAAAQKAHFFRTAWGAAPNRAAERIVAVLDLVDHGGWRIGASARDLFPSLAMDPYARFLYSAPDRFPELEHLVPLRSVYFTS